MPGLSDYKTHASSDPENIYTEDEDFSDYEEMMPGVMERMQQRFRDYLGFGDPTRVMPDMMFHGMMESIPREQWDEKTRVITPGEPQEVAPGWFVQNNDMSPEYTYRQLMETLRDLGPAYSYENP